MSTKDLKKEICKGLDGGTMPLPQREYYAFGELPKRWNTCKKQVKHVVETGKLNCCVWLKPIWMEKGELTKQKNGEEIFKPSERVCIKGFVSLRAEDCHWIFRFKRAKVSLFVLTTQSDAYLQLEDERHIPSFEMKDLVVMRNELLTFEKSYQISVTQIGHHNSHSVFSHSKDYQTVTLHGKQYRFGLMQASIIQQLHEASLTDQEWVHGNILLRNAGSESEQVKNVFSSKSDWRECIESDGRGYYKLKL